jgi:hypothetical protein
MTTARLFATVFNVGDGTLSTAVVRTGTTIADIAKMMTVGHIIRDMTAVTVKST